MSKDEMNDDAQFEAFLKGEGDLARRLQAMAQPAPRPELDADIHARVRAAMARESSGAANDPGEAGPAPLLAAGSGVRWRLPAGLAATVLAGLFAAQAHRAGDTGALTGVPAVEEVAALPQAAVAPPAAAPARSQAAQSAVRAPEVVAQSEFPPPLPEPAKARPRARARAPVVVEAPAPAPVAEAPMPSAVANASESAAEVRGNYVADHVAKPAPLTVSAPPAEFKLSQLRADDTRRSASPNFAEQRVEVSGSRIRRQDEPISAEAWVDKVEALLKTGNEEEAKREWVKLRQRYPQHAVPEALDVKMTALLE